MKKLNQNNRFVSRSTFLLTAAYLATLCASPAASQQLRYSVIPLGTASSGYEGRQTYMFPLDINNKGDIIGWSVGGLFLLRDGEVHDLDSSGDPLTFFSVSLNNRGVIAGGTFHFGNREADMTYILPTSGRHKDLNLAYAAILPFPGFCAWDINDHGVIVGLLSDPQEDVSRSVVYQDGHLNELPSLAPGRRAFGVDINNRGQIIGTAMAAIPRTIYDNFAGTRAVIFSDGRVRDLGTLPGFWNSGGTAINDHGAAVGTCHNSWSNWTGFIYTNGVMNQLPAPPHGESFIPTHINNAGDILISFSPSGEERPSSHWLYSEGGLHDLRPITAAALGWRIYYLHLNDMNDRGEIVGTAHYHDGDGRLFSQGVHLRSER